MDDVSMDEPRATATDVVCGECGAPMVLRKAPDTGPFFGCSRYPACTLTHGALADGRPKGIPGSKRDVEARKRVYPTFARLWETGRLSRDRAYSWLATVVSIPHANIGMLNEGQCKTLLAEIRKAFPDIKNVWERLRENPYASDAAPEEEERADPPKPRRKAPLFADARCKCGGCGRWMRSGKPTKKTPATRRPGPHAGSCLDCHPGGCMHFGPCNQPDGRVGTRHGIWSSTRYVGDQAYPPDILPPEGALVTSLPGVVMPDDVLATFLAVRGFPPRGA